MTLEQLVAPCGMNCALCQAYQGKGLACNGCGHGGERKACQNCDEDQQGTGCAGDKQQPAGKPGPEQSKQNSAKPGRNIQTKQQKQRQRIIQKVCDPFRRIHSGKVFLVFQCDVDEVVAANGIEKRATGVTTHRCQGILYGFLFKIIHLFFHLRETANTA